MTQTLSRPSSSGQRNDRPRGRGAVIALLIVSVLATGAMQNMGRLQREKLISRRTARMVSGLDTFTLGLLLGGLRGPLVMILWTSSENQKSEHNLESIDTKIELIRMLQADFMYVHLFQIWNKAYNLSVQVAGLQNKYAIILDALNYAFRVDDEHKDDINIQMSIAEVYFQKLGNSADKRWYVDRMRQETKYRLAVNVRTQQYRQMSHKQLLDADGMLLPELLAPDPAGIAGRHEHSGAELEFLGKYNKSGGFPDGVTPMAVSYQYYKRSQIIMATTHQRHLQLSDTVIDTRPAIALRNWAEEEWTRARIRELPAFGLKSAEELKPLDRTVLSSFNALLPLGKPVPDASEATRGEIRQALFGYARAAEVAADAEAEYNRHITDPSYSLNIENYRSHLLTVHALADMAIADRDYLALAAAEAGLVPLPPGQTGEAVRKRIAAEYQKAADSYYRLLLRYYVEAGLADMVYAKATQALSGKSFQRADIEKMDSKFYPSLHDILLKEMDRLKMRDAYVNDADEFLNYLRNIERRRDQMLGK